jgi:MarR family transcriptional regulator, temperature-dependent positive regulator of motility
MCQPARMTTPDPAALVRLVKRARADLVEVMVRGVRDAGFPVRRVHAQVFENLDPGGARLTVLAERAGMTHQAMGDLVTELVGHGLLERVPDPADGRARLVRATAAGAAAIAAGQESLRELGERWDRELDGVSVDQVVRALEKLSALCAGGP